MLLALYIMKLYSQDYFEDFEELLLIFKQNVQLLHTIQIQNQSPEKVLYLVAKTISSTVKLFLATAFYFVGISLGLHRKLWLRRPLI